MFFLIIGWLGDIAGCNSGADNPAFDAGYRLGLAAGKIDGSSSRITPGQSLLDSAARGALKSSEYANASAENQEKYKGGFESGYEVGFKEAAKPAF